MVLDIIVILIIAISAYVGYRKGLTTLLIGFIGFIIAITLAFTFKTSVANFIIQNTDIDIMINSAVTDGLNEAINNESSNVFYKRLVENMGTNETVIELSNKLVKYIIETAAFILILFIVQTCTFIVQMMLNLVFNLPILKSINNIGGLGMGLFMGLVKIWVILLVISMIAPISDELNSLIDQSYITKFLHNTNIFIKILSGDIKF